MRNLKIKDIVLTPLKQICDERGAVFHFLKHDSPNYNNFGEAYFSKINSNVIKGWKFHHLAYQNFCVPFGSVKIVVFDNRENSESRGIIEEFNLDDCNNYNLLTLPPQLWYSFKCESSSFALLANIINIAHSPEESQNLPIDNDFIKYIWA